MICITEGKWRRWVERAKMEQSVVAVGLLGFAREVRRTSVLSLDENPFIWRLT